MSKYTRIIGFVLIALTLSVWGMLDADAKRFGGGSGCIPII
jgi:hypothetical protein